MLKVDSQEFYELVGQCAVLRGLGRFDEAITLVEPRLNDMEQAARTVALLQLLYAAHEAGYADKTRHYAEETAKIDPGIPSVKKVLAAYM